MHEISYMQQGYMTCSGEDALSRQHKISTYRTTRLDQIRLRGAQFQSVLMYVRLGLYDQ
jgi:hypothetical protein